MTHRQIIPAAILGFGVLFQPGCGESRPAADQVVPIDQIPANLMAIARKELPGITFDSATKMKVDGQDAFEIRGKNKQGKTREVELSTTGEVLAIE